MPIVHRKIIDTLTQVSQEIKEGLPEKGINSIPIEELLDLAYMPGDRVIDKTTGKEGVIHAGKRATYTIPGTEKEGDQGVSD